MNGSKLKTKVMTWMKRYPTLVDITVALVITQSVFFDWYAILDVPGLYLVLTSDSHFVSFRFVLAMLLKLPFVACMFYLGYVSIGEIRKEMRTPC